MIRRLGPRLEHLYHWVTSAGHFSDIWDLCCDHGRLGLHLHQKYSARQDLPRSKIHLVDSVPAIIEKLKRTYACIIDDNLIIECRDARSIEWRTDATHLMILAGVGGGTMIDIIKGIISKSSPGGGPFMCARMEFVLSPNRNAFELRRFLCEHNFELIKEEFVTERDWHHEHMHLRFRDSIHFDNRISETGESLWDTVTEEKLNYLRMQIQHYAKRSDLGGHRASGSALAQYTRLLQRMES